MIQGEPAQQKGPLGKQYKRLKDAWENNGQAVSLRPLLAYRGEWLSLNIPESFTQDDPESCLSVAVLSSRNNLFTLHLTPAPLMRLKQSWPVSSSVGLAEIRRCGDAKKALKELRIEMRSQRGVLQILTLHSKRTPPLASEILNERIAGPQNVSPQIGPPPPLAPIEQRIEQLLRELRILGPEEIRKMTLSSTGDGSVDHPLYLDAGCHELRALPPDSGLQIADIDAELRELESGHIIAVDNSAAASASIRFCNGRPGRYHLHLSGGVKSEEIAVVEARFPIPSGIPLEWGPISRSRMAAALGAAPPLPIRSLPVLAFLGVRGQTRFSTDLIIGHCYAAAAAVMLGNTRQLAIKVRDNKRNHTSLKKSNDQGTALTFCAHQQHAQFEISADGESLNWLFALWDLESYSTDSEK